ncbi:MAG: DUF6318 family protein [Actinomycetota bacterium]
MGLGVVLWFGLGSGTMVYDGELPGQPFESQGSGGLGRKVDGYRRKWSHAKQGYRDLSWPQRILIPLVAFTICAFIAVVVAVVNDAVTDDPPPAGLPLTSADPTTSPARTETTPTPTGGYTPSFIEPLSTQLDAMPKATREKTYEGARIAAEHWVRVLNEAWLTADPQLIDGISLTSCKTCLQYQNEILKVERAGRSFEGDVVRSGGSVVEDFFSQERVLIQMSFQGLDPKIYENGEYLKRQKPDTVGYQFDMQWQEDKNWWAVAEIRNMIIGRQ